MRTTLRPPAAAPAPRHPSLAAPEPLTGWINLAAGVASLASIAAAVFIALRGPDGSRFAWVPVAYVCLLATVAIVLLGYQQLVFDRHRRYLLAVPTLQDALRVLGEATYAVMAGQTDDRAFRRSLRDSASLLATAFTQITGTQCRVAIKTVAAVPGAVGETHLGPNDFTVTTLCRSHTERRERTRTEPDLVAKNTDFRAIFQGEPYYFNNDLVAAARRFEYENSHWDQEAIKKDRVDYRSAIIWPVTPVDLDEATDTHPPVIGFVCLDSAARNVFAEQFDVALGQSFTHALNLALWALTAARPAAVQPGQDETDGGKGSPRAARAPKRGQSRRDVPDKPASRRRGTAPPT